MSAFSNKSFTTAVRESNDPMQGVNRTMTSNGHPSLTAKGQGQPVLAMFEKLVRGLEKDRIDEFLNEIFRQAELEAAPDKIVQLMLTMFQTRDCRGGKGEKDLFYSLITRVYPSYPQTVISLAECIPFYGYWKDVLLLIEEIKLHPVQGVNYSPLVSTLWKLYATKLLEDDVKLRSGSKDISFAAKWAPRKGNHFDESINAVSEMCKIMYPEIVGECLLGKDKKTISKGWGKAHSRFRKLVSRITSELEVPETYMCAQKWSEINFARVTSLCLSRNMNSFLNEDKNGETRSNSEDRIKCADNLIQKLAKLNGAQLFPHELVEKVMNGRISKNKEKVIDAQWTSIRNSVITMAEEIAAEQQGVTADEVVMTLASLIPMCDVSGSMSGIPMIVAIALSILLSEICHENFRDLVLSFSSDPVWEDLKGCTGLCEKVRKLQRSNWGMSTDFYKGFTQIAKIVEDNGISVEETPDMVVFSDMQFDTSLGGSSYGYGGGAKPESWSIMHERIVKMFHDLGMRMDGVSRLPPKIVYWNLRSDTVDYPAAADQAGVATMSGYSPSLMKFFISGQLQDETVEVVDEDTGEVKLVKKQITPLDSFMKVLSDSRLDMVRAKLAISDEGLLSKFNLDEE